MHGKECFSTQRSLSRIGGRKREEPWHALTACLWVGLNSRRSRTPHLRPERCACNDSGLYLDVVTPYARDAAIPLRDLYYLYCWQP